MHRLLLLILFLASTCALANATSSVGDSGVSTTGYLQSDSISTTNISVTNITVSGASVIPTGAVMAFDLAACPTGWAEYTAARGRFLRGIDNGAGNDPDGTRTTGATQADAFQGHQFSAGITSIAGSVYNVSPRQEGASSVTGAPTTLGAYGTPRLSSETRPKNVAVLFCRKN